MDEYIRFNGSRVKNIQGQHFGHLIPQKIVGIKNRYAVWECLCDLCGGTREVSAKRLNSCSNTTMCEKCKKEREWKAGMTKKAFPLILKAKYLYYSLIFT